MPIEFRCARCYTLLRTKEEAAGRQFDCPRCGETLTVPWPEGDTPEAVPAGSTPGVYEAGLEPPPAPSRGPGEPVNPYQAPESAETAWQPPPRGRSGAQGTASLVLGIVAVCVLPTMCCCGPFELPLVVPVSAVGLILGIVGLKAESKGPAIAGIVLNSIGLGFSLLLGLLFALTMFG